MSRTIVLDFDGVLNSYASGWCGADVIPDSPTPGAQAFVLALIEDGWEPVVQSTRAQTAEGLTAIAAWLAQHGFPILTVTCEKPPAMVYLDDRALRFEGRFPSLGEVDAAAVPWTKR